jgi:hypothetical protein
VLVTAGNSRLCCRSARRPRIRPCSPVADGGGFQQSPAVRSSANLPQTRWAPTTEHRNASAPLREPQRSQARRASIQPGSAECHDPAIYFGQPSRSKSGRVSLPIRRCGGECRRQFVPDLRCSRLNRKRLFSFVQDFFSIVSVFGSKLGPTSWGMRSRSECVSPNLPYESSVRITAM